MSRMESFSGRLSSCKMGSCDGKASCDCGAALWAGRALRCSAGVCLNAGGVEINYVSMLP